jgi:hypothetical protein
MYWGIDPLHDARINSLVESGKRPLRQRIAELEAEIVRLRERDLEVMKATNEYLVKLEDIASRALAGEG